MAHCTESIFEFLQLVSKLKTLRRTGWVLRNVANPESIADHMYRMGIMTMIAGDISDMDKDKCLKMALVHDISECIVGDITPFCNVSQMEKHKKEMEAMNHLTSLIGDSGPSLMQLYQEYADQKTTEAKFVKELDRLDMILQAFEYELEERTPGRLEEFFESTKGKFQHPWTLAVVNELYKRRKNHIGEVKQ